MSRNYIVEIVPTLNESGFDNIVDIGMINGVIRWATAYDTFETSATCATGFISDGFIGKLTKSATVERVGNYAVNGGGVVSTVSTTKLFKWLTEYSINIYNSLITIKESRDGGATYYAIRTGIIEESEDEIKGGRIPFKDSSKSTATTITKEIKDSGKFYPVNFGRLPQAKTVSIKATADLPTEVGTSGNVPVFYVGTLTNTPTESTLALFDPYSVQSSQPNWDAYWAEVSTILQTTSLGVKQGDIILPIETITNQSNLVNIELKSGNALTTDTGGIVVAISDVNLYVTIVPFGVNSYDDYFDGERITNDLYNYEEGEFVKLPLVRDEEDIEGEEVSITDADSAGYDVIPMTCNLFEGRQVSAGGTFFPMPLTGAIANLTDLNSSTFAGFDVSTSAQTYEYINVVSRFDVAPIKAPEGDILFSFHYDGNFVSDVGGTLPFLYWLEVYDKFGNIYTIGSLSAPIYSIDAPINSYTDPRTNYKFTKTDVVDYIVDGDAYSWKNGGVATDTRAGIEAVVDFSEIPSIVWETGFELAPAMVLDNTAGGDFTDWKSEVYQIQLIQKRDFKSDEVYTNLEGRKEQDGTFTRTLRDVYRHCLMLQNYNNRAIVEPVDGWGLAYPSFTSWEQIYSEIDLTNIQAGQVSFQIMNSADARTDKIKAEICRLNWCIGYTDKDGIERVKSMNNGLYNTNGTLITYGDLFKNQLPTRTDRKYSSVFSDASFEYEYNTATEGTNKSVNVVSNGNGDFDDQSSLLYSAYNVKNLTPQQISSCKWLSDYNGGIKPYINGFFEWQGIKNEVAYRRYTAKITVPYDFAVDNDLDIASSILLQVPNFTYYNGTKLSHSGIITAIENDIWGDTPKTTITAEMLGEEIPKVDRLIYEEIGTATDEIIETGTQTDDIEEG